MTAAGCRLLQQGGDVESRQSQPPAVPGEVMMRHAFYPLTLPLTVGPGTISVAITLKC